MRKRAISPDQWETGQAIFHHTGITGAQYYISKALGFSRLKLYHRHGFPLCVLELTVTFAGTDCPS